MEDLGCRVLTAQNGPEVLSIERPVSRLTDLVMPHGISGGEARVGLFGKNVAGRRWPAEGAAKLRSVLAGEYQTDMRQMPFARESPARPALALSGSAICAKGSRLW